MQLYDTTYAICTERIWDFGDGTRDTVRQPDTVSHAYDSAGIYDVTLYIRNDTVSCIDSVTQPVEVYPLPPATTGEDTLICRGDSVRLGASPTDSNNYQWFPTSGLSDPTAANPWAFPNTTRTYQLTERDTNGCEYTNSVTVSVSDPVADAGPDRQLCEGEGTQLGDTTLSSYTYSWQPAWKLDDTTAATPWATPDSTITYRVVVTDSYGCRNTDEVTVTVRPGITAAAGPDTAVCAGEWVSLRASGGYRYFWQPDEDLSSAISPNPLAFPDESITYRVVVTGDSVCRFQDTATVSIQVYSPPVIEVSPDTTIAPGGEAFLRASGGNNYRWSPERGLSCANCPSPTATPTISTIYEVTVTDSNGCSSTDSVRVKVAEEGDAVFIPNAFSPDGDGLHERFYVQGWGVAEVKKLYVYDRWGNRVYAGENIPANTPSLGWDGRYRGVPAVAGVYVYRAELKLKDGQTVHRKGNLTLVR
jgi:gliding motility-associated-like protein